MNKNSNKKNKFTKTITSLCEILEINRDTFYNYKNSIDAPKKKASGYDVEAWREFLESNGVYIESARAKNTDTNNTHSKKTKTYSELKNELTQKDIELRQIKIDKENGKLINRDTANLALIGLTQLYKAQLESLPRVVASKLKDIKLESKLKKEIDRILEDTLDRVKQL